MLADEPRKRSSNDFEELTSECDAGRHLVRRCSRANLLIFGRSLGVLVSSPSENEAPRCNLGLVLSPVEMIV